MMLGGVSPRRLGAWRLWLAAAAFAFQVVNLLRHLAHLPPTVSYHFGSDGWPSRGARLPVTAFAILTVAAAAGLGVLAAWFAARAAHARDEVVWARGALPFHLG